MKSHVAKTVSACIAVLHQLRSVRRSLSRSILQSLVSSLVLSRLDYGNATLAGIPSYLLQQLQSLMNSAARLVFSSSRFDHITPLLRQLHWLRAPGWIQLKLTVLVYSVCTGWHRLTSPMSSSARLISRPRDSFAPPSHHCSLSVVLDCPSSLIGPSLSPLPILGTVCLNTSRPHPPCLFTEDA